MSKEFNKVADALVAGGMHRVDVAVAAFMALGYSKEDALRETLDALHEKAEEN